MIKPELKFLVRYLLMLVVLALVSIFALVNYHFQREALNLVGAGKRIEATIFTKNCANAGLVYYRFKLNEQEFKGSGNACVASCAKAEVGASVAVTYAANNPENSICGSPEQAAARFNINYYALLLVGLGLLAVVVRATKK